MNDMDFISESRDEGSCDDRDMIEYHAAIDAAEAAGEPQFSFEDFMFEVTRQARASAPTIPAPSDDQIPF